MIANFLFKIPWLHPPKINMEAENHGFQKEPPFPGAHFHSFHVKLQGTCRICFGKQANWKVEVGRPRNPIPFSNLFLMFFANEYIINLRGVFGVLM